MVFLHFRLFPHLKCSLLLGFFLNCWVPAVAGFLFLHRLATPRELTVMAAHLYHCVTKGCPIILFVILPAVNDIILTSAKEIAYEECGRPLAKWYFCVISAIHCLCYMQCLGCLGRGRQ